MKIYVFLKDYKRSSEAVRAIENELVDRIKELMSNGIAPSYGDTISTDDTSYTVYSRVLNDDNIVYEFVEGRKLPNKVSFTDGEVFAEMLSAFKNMM